MSHNQLQSLRNQYLSVLKRVTGWKTILTQWQIGTKDEVIGERRAVEQLRESLMTSRIRLDALIELLMASHQVSEADLLVKQIEVAARVDGGLQQMFSGAVSTEDGVEIVDAEEFEETKARLGFPL